MKILIVNKFLHPNGGSETYIFEVGKQLQKMGHQVEYFGMEHNGRIVGNHAQSYTCDMDFHNGKQSKLLYPFKIIYSTEARKKIRKVLNDFKPDVVHLNNFTYQITPSILYEIKAYEKKHMHAIKIVATIHDPQLVCPNHMLINGSTRQSCDKCLNGKYRNCAKDRCIHGSRIKSVLGAIESRLYRSLHTYRFIDTIICPSKFMEKIMNQNPDIKGRTVMLRNFISIPPTTLKDHERKRDYVLYFGRYSEEKGIKTAINAAKELPEIPFVFAGNGPFEREVNQVSNITNKGFITGQELSDLIANAAFSLITSECFENCPFTVMESQILHTPVIGSDIGGIPELIHEGIDGELFESGNVSDLMQKISTLWNQPEKQRQYLLNCCKLQYSDVEEYCEKLVKLY